MFGLSALTGMFGGSGGEGGGGGGGLGGLSMASQFTPDLGATTTTVSTGASANTINFGKDENDFIKYGIMAGAVILALVIFKRKK